MKKRAKVTILIVLVFALLGIYFVKTGVFRSDKDGSKVETLYVKIENGKLNSTGLPTLVEFSTDN